MGQCVSADPQFAAMHNVEQVQQSRCRLMDRDGWLEFGSFDPPLSADLCYLLVETESAAPLRVSVVHLPASGKPYSDYSFRFSLTGGEEPATHVVDLGVAGRVSSEDKLQLRVSGEPGVEFQVNAAKLMQSSDVPENFIPSLVGLRCFTSKLHYQPGEDIPYKATLLARSLPDRESSKILTVRITDEDGHEVASDTQHFGVQPIHNVKELHGILKFDGKAQPGKYRLEARLIDQRSRLTLTASHDFGVQCADDPLVYETPFKFVKDFSIIKGPDGLWHVFSITGDFTLGHDWYPDGQERTFSHGTSPDLRHWTYHAPVLSISDDPYPDGNGEYKNRNIWAPHVIEQDGTYYMFYTSVNEYASQTISIATSKDLFNWVDHPGNPVFSLEDVEWANWRRTGFSSCRDPMVLADGGRFYLYVTAEAAQGEDRGIVVVAESEDLLNWGSPRVAVCAPVVSESAHVWKSGGKYYMVTSSIGAATYVSDNPVSGWQRSEFPRCPVRKLEKYVSTSRAYAEEIVHLEDGGILVAACTFRHWGNSIYFFKMEIDENGRPTGYASPFQLR